MKKSSWKEFQMTLLNPKAYPLWARWAGEALIGFGLSRLPFLSKCHKITQFKAQAAHTESKISQLYFCAHLGIKKEHRILNIATREVLRNKEDLKKTKKLLGDSLAEKYEGKIPHAIRKGVCLGTVMHLAEKVMLNEEEIDKVIENWGGGVPADAAAKQAFYILKRRRLPLEQGKFTPLSKSLFAQLYCDPKPLGLSHEEVDRVFACVSELCGLEKMKRSTKEKESEAYEQVKSFFLEDQEKRPPFQTIQKMKEKIALQLPPEELDLLCSLLEIEYTKEKLFEVKKNKKELALWMGIKERPTWSEMLLEGVSHPKYRHLFEQSETSLLGLINEGDAATSFDLKLSPAFKLTGPPAAYPNDAEFLKALEKRLSKEPEIHQGLYEMSIQTGRGYHALLLKIEKSGSGWIIDPNFGKVPFKAGQIGAKMQQVANCYSPAKARHPDCKKGGFNHQIKLFKFSPSKEKSAVPGRSP